MDDVILYTCITGRYDQLHEFPTPFRKICFTDRMIFSSSWEVLGVDMEPKVFRKVKIKPQDYLPPHKRSIWIDGHLELQDFTLAGRSGFWLMKHPVRSCIYQEAQECLALKKDRPEIISEQINRYTLEGYPANRGLSATGVIIRDNDPKYYPFSELWWHQVKTGSVRDQLSFNYCAWKTGLEYEQFPFLEGVKKWKHTRWRYQQRRR